MTIFTTDLRPAANRPMTAFRRTARLPDQITVEHGPREQLARFFLAADKAARDRGVMLTLSTDFELLREVNARNSGSWHGLAPAFDAAYGGINASNGFWIIGTDADGQIVTTQAARYFDLGNESLADYLTSLRLFYPDPERQKRPGESCTVTAPSAARISGRIVFSGSGWVHPDYRRRHMMLILPRISRALALTKWDIGHTISLVSMKLVQNNVAAAYGYRNIEPGIEWLNSSVSARYEGALVWMGREEQLNDMAQFPAQLEAAETRQREMREAAEKPVLLPA